MQRTMSSPLRAGSARTVGLFALLVLLQVGFLQALTGIAKGDPFSFVVALAAGGPMVGLVLFLFPGQALLIAPLLILLPVRLMFLQAFEFVFMAAILVYGLRYLATHSIDVRLRGIDVAFLLYLVWGLFSITQAESTRIAILGMTPAILFFFAFWAGSRILGLARMPTLMRVYAWITIGIALETLGVGLAHGVSVLHLFGQLGKYTDVGWGRSNYIAAVAALTTAAVLPGAFQWRGKDRALAIAALVAAVFVALATASRGGTVALLLSVILGLTIRRLNVLLTLSLAGAVAAFMFFSSFGQAHFLGPKGLPSIGARFLFFREAIRIALSHPVAGVGPDQIPYHTYFYMDAHPHNIFLKQATDMGFVGLGLYLLLLGLVARHLVLLQRQRTRGAAAYLQFAVLGLVFLTALTNASYEPTLEEPQYGFLFWLMVGTLTPVPREETGPA